MPFKETITIYEIHELPERSKRKALDRWRERYADYSAETTKEMIAAGLEDKNLPTDDIRFSLSYCQGDGVAFYGEIPEKGWRKFIPDSEEKEFMQLGGFWPPQFTIEPNGYGHHYSHWNTMELHCYHSVSDSPLLSREQEEKRDAIVDRWEKRIKTHIQEMSRTLERAGYSVIEHEESDEVVESVIATSGVRYLKDGTTFCDSWRDELGGQPT